MRLRWGRTRCSSSQPHLRRSLLGVDEVLLGQDVVELLGLIDAEVEVATLVHGAEGVIRDARALGESGEGDASFLASLDEIAQVLGDGDFLVFLESHRG